MAFRVDWAMVRDRFDKQEPVVVCVVQNHIRHLAVFVHRDAKSRKAFSVEIARLLAGVADVDNFRAGRESWREGFDDLPNQFAVTAGGIGMPAGGR